MVLLLLFTFGCYCVLGLVVMLVCFLVDAFGFFGFRLLGFLRVDLLLAVRVLVPVRWNLLFSGAVYRYTRWLVLLIVDIVAGWLLMVWLCGCVRRLGLCLLTVYFWSCGVWVMYDCGGLGYLWLFLLWIRDCVCCWVVAQFVACIRFVCGVLVCCG